MKPEEFCYWLNGFFEMSKAKTLTEEQVKVLKNHLDLVFENVTSTNPKPKLEESGKLTIEQVRQVASRSSFRDRRIC